MDKRQGPEVHPSAAAQDSLPEGCDPRALGLDSRRLTRVTLLHRRHGHALFWLGSSGRSFVLKWFPDPGAAWEVRNYALLEGAGVPTLPVHGRTAQALLLEDLATSPTWRLATEADTDENETGAALAAWYRALHAGGRTVVAAPGGPPAHLRREVDALDAPGVLALGARLGLESDPVWREAAAAVERLRPALRALPETLIHNDFHWTNLALARRRADAAGRGAGESATGGPRALVFDHHRLQVGPVASDVRNVAGALGPRAGAAFREAYGPVDLREAALDAPIAILYALQEAVARPVLPGWAQRALPGWIEGGELTRCLRHALAVVPEPR